MVRLSVLDYAQVDEGRTGQEAIADSLRLAQTAEKLGYHRFWVAEHHNVPAFASSSPELLMMYILGETQQLRVGSGGVMLPHYSPFKVAENFRMLEAAHPGRVDLGYGNTLGTPLVNDALNEMKTGRIAYEKSVRDIYHYLTGSEDEAHRFAGLQANPSGDNLPQMFQLTTSKRGALNAAKAGVGLCFGLFPNASSNKLDVGREAAEIYRKNFRPSKVMAEPYVMFAPFVVLSEDEAELSGFIQALDIWLLGKQDFAEFSAFPSVETAANYKLTPADQEAIEANRTRMITGNAADVKAQLDRITEHFAADEILFIPLMPGVHQRQQALELLAEEYGQY